MIKLPRYYRVLGSQSAEDGLEQNFLDKCDKIKYKYITLITIQSIVPHKSPHTGVLSRT